MTESQTPPLKQKHVVILVNGIHSRGQWMDIIKPDLLEKGFIVTKTSYKLFNVVELLLPFSFFKNMAVKRAKKSILASISMHPNARFYIIAHSFGTYLVSKIINELEEIPFHRIIFCGSIVDEGQINFDKNKIKDFPEDGNWILNEVGGIDWLPVFAQNLTFGFGSAGSNGYNQPYVETRRHEGIRHSDFFTNSFCKNHWLPFLEKGELTPPNPNNYSNKTLIDKIRNLYHALKKSIISLNYWGLFDLTKYALWIFLPLYGAYILVKDIENPLKKQNSTYSINAESLFSNDFSCSALKGRPPLFWKNNYFNGIANLVIIENLKSFEIDNVNQHYQYKSNAENALSSYKNRFPSLHFELSLMKAENRQVRYVVIFSKTYSRALACDALFTAKNCLLSKEPYTFKLMDSSISHDCSNLTDAE